MSELSRMAAGARDAQVRTVENEWHLAMLGIISVENSWRTLHRRLSRMTLDDESQEACAVLVKYLGSGNVPVWEDEK